MIVIELELLHIITVVDGSGRRPGEVREDGRLRGKRDMRVGGCDDAE